MTPIPPLPDEAQWNRMALAVIGAALLIFGVALTFALRSDDATVAAGPPTATPIAYCTTKDGKKVYDLVKVYAQEWDDADELANSTSRMSLAPQIGQLQRIRRDVQAQQYPSCGQKAQMLLVETMDATIDGYIAFLSQKSDSVVSSYIKQANTKQVAFLTALAELEAPLPSPSPSPKATTTVQR